MNAIPKLPRRRVDGVLLLDKPAGMTSNAALQAAKRLFNAAKAGHTGTLDPLATGLLPLCFGEATKFAQTLLDADKAYMAEIELGVSTSTGDAEGDIIERRPVAATMAQLESVLTRFRGEIDQVPPMHSALKRDGRPLYELARQGIEIERAPRRVRIDALIPRCFAGSRLDVEISCSKGTYIRALAADIGEALGCGAHLAALRRTRIGNLELAQAVPLQRLQAADVEQRDALLLPPDTLLARLPAVVIDAESARRFSLGQQVSIVPAVSDAGMCRVYGGERFLGVGRSDGGGRLAPLRLAAA